MRKATLTAYEYRKIILNEHIRFRSLGIPSQDTDREFRIYLEQAYKEDKGYLTDVLEYGDVGAKRGYLKDKILHGMTDTQAIELLRHSLFKVAVGLVAYGRLNVVEDVLDNLPSPHNRIRLLAKVLTLIPIPENIDPLANPEVAKTWFRDNSPLLRWDEEQERYIFKENSVY